ncbi:MAG: protein kinase, partial [Bacteroidales bacterium]|nr:protein kinase [Bacteroidales bacterium]
MKTAKTKDSASRMLLRREWEISRNLQHPLIASSFAFLEDSPVGPAIKMEYVDGRTLREFAASTPSLSLRKKIFSQILDAVEYLHHKGLLHNDIKPENVMVTFVGNDVKLIDFGLAESDSDYLNKRLGGTEGSSAPEVLAGDTSESSTASADIYSLGLILDLLFPGRYFFVKRKCLKKSAEARFADVASLRRAVDGVDIRRKSFAALATVAALAGLAFVIREVTKTEIVPEEEVVTGAESVQEVVNEESIRKDLTGFCRLAADSLADRTLVPDWEKASSVCNNINRKVADYRNSLKDSEQRYICDTVYARLSSGLSKIASEIPMRDEAVVKKPDVPATPLSFTSGAAIDLGLPSGLMWASCNLCESGFVSSPEIFGDYYAWGETQPYYISQNPFIWKD